MSKKVILMMFLFMVCLSCSGCSLLTLPFQIIGGAGHLLGKAFAFADSLPKPPPGVFF